MVDLALDQKTIFRYSLAKKLAERVTACGQAALPPGIAPANPLYCRTRADTLVWQVVVLAIDPGGGMTSLRLAPSWCASPVPCQSAA
jgi:hypothetical protein